MLFKCIWLWIVLCKCFFLWYFSRLHWILFMPHVLFEWYYNHLRRLKGMHLIILNKKHRNRSAEVFLGKGVPEICSKFVGKNQCQDVILIKLFCNFIEILLRHGCPLVNLLHIFKTPFAKSTSGRLLLTARFLNFGG